MRVYFGHLDLGIGGAERLVVNLALGLHQDGQDVHLFTTHHDPTHCFEETKPGEVLGKKVTVYGEWLPRQVIGRFTALCSIIRMIWLCIILIGHYWTGHFDVLVLDGVSAPLPLLWLFGVPTLFYCHYPDKLLCTKRDALVKRVYRFFIDALEDMSICCAHAVVCNSQFTRNKVKASFPLLAALTKGEQQSGLSVLYPPVEDVDDETFSASIPAPDYLGRDGDEKETCPFFLSLNRYERKKDIGLALRALVALRRATPETKEERTRRTSGATTTTTTTSGRTPHGHAVVLVIAGGHDPTVLENVDYKKELEEIAREAGVTAQVVFRTSICDSERSALLRHAAALLYTPSNEHFGIVPLEAMLVETPVIAVRSGGPLETVVDHGSHPTRSTGFLVSPTADAFAAAMRDILNDPTEARRMGMRGRERVRDEFLLAACTRKLLAGVRESMERASVVSTYFCQGVLWTVLLAAMMIPLTATASTYTVSGVLNALK